MERFARAAQHSASVFEGPDAPAEKSTDGKNKGTTK
jgi:hypothetical protein